MQSDQIAGAPQLQPQVIAHRYITFDQLINSLRNQKPCASFLVDGLNSACNIDRITNDGDFFVLSQTHGSGNDLAVMNAHPDIEIPAICRLQVGFEFIHCTGHFQTGAHRPKRLLFGLFQSKNGQYGVADIVIYFPAMSDDHLPHYREIAVQDEDHVIG